MNTLQFVAELIHALIWPLTVLVLALLFRTEIRALLGRIKRGKVGPAELEFEAAMRSLESESKVVAAPSPQAARVSSAAALVGSDPRAAIISAWLQVEDAIEQLLFSRSKSADDVPRNRAALLRELTRRELLAPEHIALLNDLRALRNQAVHEVEFNPSRESVLGYVRLAQEMLAAIHQAVDDIG